MAPELEKKRIFVLDDEPETRIFLANLLATGGFEPVIVEAGERGLQEVMAQFPALIILDVIRYRDRHTTFYRRLKHHEQLRKIPVIMVSSVERNTFFHCQKFKHTPPGSGLPEPEAYLQKPLEADELLRIVQQLTRTGDYHATG